MKYAKNVSDTTSFNLLVDSNWNKSHQVKFILVLSKKSEPQLPKIDHSFFI